MRFPLSILLCSALALVACETTVDLDIGSYEPQLVINSFFESDTTLTLHLSRSAGSGSGQAPRAVAGRVLLFENGELVEELAPECCDPGYYTSAFRPRAGQTYRVRAEAAALPPVEATVQLPASIPVELVSVAPLPNPEPFGVTDRVTLRFTDPPGEVNYYALSSPFQVYVEGEPDPDQLSSRARFVSDDPVLREGTLERDLIDGNPARSSYGYAFFSDAAFDGRTYTLVFDVQRQSSDVPSVTYEQFIRLDALSPIWYQFQRATSLDLAANPFTEPVQYPSNVQGGLGIFAGVTRTVIRLPAP